MTPRSKALVLKKLSTIRDIFKDTLFCTACIPPIFLDLTYAKQCSTNWHFWWDQIFLQIYKQHYATNATLRLETFLDFFSKEKTKNDRVWTIQKSKRKEKGVNCFSSFRGKYSRRNREKNFHPELETSKCHFQKYFFLLSSVVTYEAPFRGKEGEGVPN